MKSVTKYESNDGQLFDTKEEATHHDEIIELEKWYEDHKLYGKTEGSRIDWEDLLEWLQENQEVVKKIVFST